MTSQHVNLEAGPKSPCSLPLFAYALSPGRNNRCFFLITPLHLWCFDFDKCNQFCLDLQGLHGRFGK